MKQDLLKQNIVFFVNNANSTGIYYFYVKNGKPIYNRNINIIYLSPTYGSTYVDIISGKDAQQYFAFTLRKCPTRNIYYTIHFSVISTGSGFDFKPFAIGSEVYLASYGYLTSDRFLSFGYYHKKQDILSLSYNGNGYTIYNYEFDTNTLYKLSIYYGDDFIRISLNNDIKKIQVSKSPIDCNKYIYYGINADMDSGDKIRIYKIILYPYVASVSTI